MRGVIIEQIGPILYQVSVDDDILRRHIDQLHPGSMASTDTRTSESDSIDGCPVCESSLQTFTESVPNTPESSTSTDQERHYPEREHCPTYSETD